MDKTFVVLMKSCIHIWTFLFNFSFWIFSIELSAASPINYL